MKDDSPSFEDLRKQGIDPVTAWRQLRKAQDLIVLRRHLERSRREQDPLMFSTLRQRLDELERKSPGEVTFFLATGGTVRYPGGALLVFDRASNQIAEGQGPLYSVVRDAVGADNFGRMLEILQAMMPPGSEKAE